MQEIPETIYIIIPIYLAWQDNYLCDLAEGEYWSPTPAVHHYDAEQVARDIHQDTRAHQLMFKSKLNFKYYNLRKKFVKGSPDRLVEANARP